MSKIALIDMDGTIADFDKAMSAKLEQLRLPLGYSPEFKEIRSLIKESPGFWRNLEKIEAGFHVLDIMRDIGFSLNILTKGPERSTNAWTAKVEWCQEHVPDASITISQDKSIVYGRVLFDDWPPYVEGWLANRPRGQVIMLPHPWNAEFKHPQVFTYHGQADDKELIRILTEAYER